MIGKKRLAAALAVLAVALLGVCSNAVAQEPIEGGPRKGTKSLNVFGSIDDLSDNTSGTIFGSLGIFVTDKLEAGPVLGLFITDDDTSGVIGGQVRYNFGLLGQGTVPYVGLGLLTDFGDDASGDFLYTLAAGARFFIKPQQAIFVEFNHRGVTDGGDDTQSIQFGLTFFIQ